MIAKEITSIQSWETIKHFILENKIVELYTDVQNVSKDINESFESTILDTIDLSLEALHSSDNKSAIRCLEGVRKNIIGDKYDYMKVLMKY